MKRIPDNLSPLGVEVEIGVPAHARLNLTAVAKPILDGVVAAFHRHLDDGTTDIVTSRVAAQLRVPDLEARAILTENPSAVLGARRLMWPWRDGVQWNPGDDRFVALRIRRVSSEANSQRNEVSLKGSLYELSVR